MPKEYDPAMHSAEHMLNQTMVRMFDCGRCINAHVERKKSRIDYRFPRALTAEEIAGIERRMNETIAADLPVTEEFMPRTEAARLFNLRRVPDEAGETLRIVRIGSYDACPCIGPHVRSTAEIGAFRIVSVDHTGDVLRIRFRLDRPV